MLEADGSEIAFFGGSFDPPHLGHVFAAAYARAHGFERVIVAPVKTHAFGKRLSAYEHRLRMAELAFETLSQVEVSDLERHLPEPSFTLSSVQALLQRNPSWKLRLLIGSDVLADASKWYRFDELTRLAPPFVVARPERDVSVSPPASPFERPWFLPDVSSTELREALRARKDPKACSWAAAALPAKVLDYIEREGLYL